MVKLTPKLIAHELPDEKCQSLQKLALPGRSIEKVRSFSGGVFASAAVSSDNMVARRLCASVLARS